MLSRMMRDARQRLREAPLMIVDERHTHARGEDDSHKMASAK